MPSPSAQKDLPKKLLAWYARHRRDLPWRARNGETPDPYRVWLSEIMLQQTTVKAVIPYFEKFTKRWPDVQSLARAGDNEVMAAWAGLGYYSRARKLIECARLVAARDTFPETHDTLLQLPGIGPYTAAAIASIAFNERAAVVDGNVERVITRIYAIETPLPQARPEIRARVDALTPKEQPGDFAQGMMDLGATICTPRNPACIICPVRMFCEAFSRGEQERFPVKSKKPARPKRFAAAYWIERDGHVLLRRRPPKGLLGGMNEVPSEGWRDDFSPLEFSAPLKLAFEILPGFVTHVFTHFELEMTVFTARAPRTFKTPEGSFWQPLSKIDEAGLPSVMQKVVNQALSSSSLRKRGSNKERGLLDSRLRGNDG